MNRVYARVFCLASMLVSPQLFAHTELLANDGFHAGLLHPLLGIDHTLVMLGVGLLAATQRLVVAKQIITLFLLTIVLGAFLGIYGVQCAYVETAILLSLIVVGGLLLLGCKSVPQAILGSLIAISALLHGLVHGLEVQLSVSALSYLVGLVVATGLLLGVGFTLGLVLNRGKTRWIIHGVGACTSMLGAWLLFA